MNKIYYILMFLITFFSCGKQNQKEGGESKNSTQLEKEKFKWDFNSGNIYSYSFNQITNSINNWEGGIEHKDTSDIMGKGILNIKSKGKNKADFVLTDLKIKTDIYDKLNYKEEDDLKPGKTMVVQNMDANGNFGSKKSNYDVMFDFVFPLPSYDLEIGDKEKLELEIPYNIMGSPLYVKGFNEIEYLRDEKRGQSRNAILKSKIQVDKLDVPTEIKGIFECSFIGEAEYEFNYEDSYFISATIELDIVMRSKYNSGEKLIGKIDMDMKSNNQYEIKFIKIEKE